MVAAGATDQAISDKLGGGIGRMAVSRHRRNHVLAPARSIAAAAAKGQDVATRRAEVVAAAEAGDPLAWVTAPAIVNDLRTVHDRLERSAGAAEEAGQRLAVATLSAQQLRAAEVRAKIGGVGQFAPGKGGVDGPGAQFSITINLGDQSGTVIVGPQPDAHVLDAEPDLD
jgi:hypothetical protein